jgi:hypothetical protein
LKIKLSCQLLTKLSLVNMLAIGTQFDTVAKAREAIIRYVLDRGESYVCGKSDKKRYYVKCNSCEFFIGAAERSNGVIIYRNDPHTCSPDTHYERGKKQAGNKRYTAPHHKAAVIDNRNITIKQIQTDERLRHGNSLTYMQARRAKEEILKELDGNEEETYQQMVDYMDRLKVADPKTGVYIARHIVDGELRFQSIVICPSATRYASRFFRRFFGFDATHTKSKYCQMLMIMAGIDANGNILPLAWALVPTENEYWWQWFCGRVDECFPHFQRYGAEDPDDLLSHKFVFISDRDKGLKSAIRSTWKNGIAAHCCQHIADNVQAYHGGVKLRVLFWRAARAKTFEAFDVSSYFTLTSCYYTITNRN